MEFWTLADLERSLAEAGLQDRLADVPATARPGISLLRRLTPDDPLPPGTSKHGGFPDLPAGAAWPMGAVNPKADRLAAETQRDHERSVKHAEELNEEGPRPHRRFFTQADFDQMAAQCQAEKAALFRPFPLSFTMQVNMAAFSTEPGFDPLFPRHGLLSVFFDLRSQGHKDVRLLWHDGPVDALVRQQPPEDLVARYDFENTRPGTAGGSWSEQTASQTLHPISVITVNADIWSPTRPSEDQDAFYDWQRNRSGCYPEKQARHVKGSSDSIGGHLGGWPYLYHGDPGAELPGGRAAWRHVCSWSGEHGEGRDMPSISVGTGYHYVLMRPDDIVARRFCEARLVIQHE